MRRLVLVLALTVFSLTVAFGGAVLAQDIPTDKGGGPETGCEGIQTAAELQNPGTEPSATQEVANAHTCALGGPKVYEPGQSGGR